MPVLTDKDFAKFAAAAASDLVDHNVSLNDSCAKIAAAHDMNREQLQRLCEATNNAAFTAAFEAKGKQASADRLVEFPVADAAEILSRGTVGTKTAAVQPRKYFDELEEIRPLADYRKPALPAECFSKVASAEEITVSHRIAAKTAEADARTLNKALSTLQYEKISCGQKTAECIEALTGAFRKIYAPVPFAVFEKEAMSTHGVAADGLLDMLRRELRLPGVVRDHTKVARAQLKFDTVEHRYLAEAVASEKRSHDIQQTLARYGQG